jgi:RNA polymerase sigma factor (sigma-70 family)
MSLDDAGLTRMIGGLRTGDSRVLHDFWQHFGPMLERLADRNLAPAMRRRLGPEDVAQSVCRTFIRRAQEGQFDFGSGNELWRLLCAITLTKVREKTRHHMRKKRGLQNEVALGGSEESGTGFTPAADDPSPVAEAEFADLLQAAIAVFSDEERQMLELRLQGYQHEEIAQQLRCSVRTVGRILTRVQSQFEKLLREGD